MISGSLAPRGRVLGRPKAWLAPGQAPFVPGQHISFYSIQVNEHPPNTCCIPCPAPGTTMRTHLRTAQPLSSRSSQAHSTHVLAELRTEVPWMGTPILKPQLLPGGARGLRGLGCEMLEDSSRCICQLITQEPELLPEAEAATGRGDSISNALRGRAGLRTSFSSRREG